jgi:hypothetical protein
MADPHRPHPCVPCYARSWHFAGWRKYSTVKRLIGVLYNLNSRRSISKVFAAKTLSGNFSNLQFPWQCRLTLVEVVPVRMGNRTYEGVMGTSNRQQESAPVSPIQI